MRFLLFLSSILVIGFLFYDDNEAKPSRWHIDRQIKALKRIQEEMNISDPVIRERETRYIQEQIDSLMSGSSYERDEIGPEILVEKTKS